MGVRHVETFPQSVVFEVVFYFTLVSFWFILQLCCKNKKKPEELKKWELKPVSVYTDLRVGNFIECIAMLLVQLNAVLACGRGGVQSGQG